MDFNVDDLLDDGGKALELGKDPKKVIARNTVKSYVKYGFGTALAAPAALGLVLSDEPVIAKLMDYIEMRNMTVTSSFAASHSLSLNSAIVVTTTEDNVTIGKDGKPWVFTTLLR